VTDEAEHGARRAKRTHRAAPGREPEPERSERLAQSPAGADTSPPAVALARQDRRSVLSRDRHRPPHPPESSRTNQRAVTPATPSAPGARTACMRSEDSDAHMPLPKRGPHLRKRPPSPRPRTRGRSPAPSFRARDGRAPRRAGAAGSQQRRPGRTAAQTRARERATRPGEAASPTRPRSSTQSAHHVQNRQNRTDRAPTDARPRLQPPVPTPDSSPALPPPNTASHTDGRPTRLKSDTNPPVTPALPVAAAPPRPTSTRLGKPAPHLPGTSRKGGSGAKRRTPPSSKAQARSEGNGRGRGGGLLRSAPKPIERNRWRETQGRKQSASDAGRRQVLFLTRRAGGGVRAPGWIRAMGAAAPAQSARGSASGGSPPANDRAQAGRPRCSDRRPPRSGSPM
jgi:hypothetical protein